MDKVYEELVVLLKLHCRKDELNQIDKFQLVSQAKTI